MKIKRSLVVGCLTALLGVGAAVGAGFAAEKAPVKEAEAWSGDKTNWYLIGSMTNNWQWSTSWKFVLNDSTQRYESPTFTSDGNASFKITLGASWNNYQVHANNVDWNGKGFKDYCTKSGDDIKVTTAGTYRLYFIGSEIEAWDAHWAFYIEQVHTYTVSNGSTNVTMTRISAGGDCDQQYEGVMNLTAGQTISFKQDGSSLSTVIQGSDMNNVWSDTKKVIETKSSAHIYLKHNGSTWFFYVTGRTTKYFVVVGSTPYAMSPNTAAAEGNFMYTGLDLFATNTFKLYGDGYFAPSGDNFGQDAGLGFSSNGTVVTCTKDGTYNIYLDATQYNAKLYIAGQSAADIKATAFSNAFLNAYEASRGGMCNSQGSTGAAYESQIASVWTTLKNNYTTNVSGNADAVNILKNADKTAETLYGQFAALYDKIYHDYGAKLSLNNFAQRSVSSVGKIVPVIPGMTNNDSSNTIIWVVVASAITLAAVGGFFFIKRRKHDR